MWSRKYSLRLSVCHRYIFEFLLQKSLFIEIDGYLSKPVDLKKIFLEYRLQIKWQWKSINYVTEEKPKKSLMSKSITLSPKKSSSENLNSHERFDKSSSKSVNKQENLTFLIVWKLLFKRPCRKNPIAISNVISETQHQQSDLIKGYSQERQLCHLFLLAYCLIFILFYPDFFLLKLKKSGRQKNVAKIDTIDGPDCKLYKSPAPTSLRFGRRLEISTQTHFKINLGFGQS